MTVDIDEVFADLYPGSKRKRRSVDRPTEKVEPPWDATPTIKAHNGRHVEFFNTGALAKALGRSAVTVRYWERKGHIPKAPYRLPGHTTGQGKQVPGRRLYSRELIDVVVDEFAKRGLLGKSRVEWAQNLDLTIAIAERWQPILKEE